jgi:hypothetical protein
MSTAKLREALDLMKEIQGFSTAETHAAAMHELVAIVRTAQDIEAFGEVSPASEDEEEIASVAAAARLLSTIAKENLP